MPGMDGWTVLSALKADPDLADIPVVMVTMVSERALAFARGVAEHVTKPVDPRLLAIVSDLVNGHGRRVLVVDDDERVREPVRRTLEKGGFTVSEADDGRSALELIATGAPPSLLLVDLMMPVMDGFELVEALRAEGGLRAIPIVVMTAKDLTPADRERLGGSVEHIVLKSGGGADLLDEIERLVSARARRGTEA